MFEIIIDLFRFHQCLSGLILIGTRDFCIITDFCTAPEYIDIKVMPVTDCFMYHKHEHDLDPGLSLLLVHLFGTIYQNGLGTFPPSTFSKCNWKLVSLIRHTLYKLTQNLLTKYLNFQLSKTLCSICSTCKEHYVLGEDFWI